MTENAIAYAVGTSVAKVILGALVVGLLHPHPWVLAVVLAVLLVFKYWLDYKKSFWKKDEKRSLLVGMLLAFCLGYLSEWIGTRLGWWTYRYYEVGFKVPPWVPLGWVFAFRIFYRIESVAKNFKNRFPLMLVIVLLLPPLGEIIAISFGTWKYAFQPQFLGMPLQAVLLIALVHGLNFYLVKWTQTAPE